MGTLRSEDSDDGENVASKMKFFLSIYILFILYHVKFRQILLEFNTQACGRARGLIGPHILVLKNPKMNLTIPVT